MKGKTSNGIEGLVILRKRRVFLCSQNFADLLFSSCSFLVDTPFDLSLIWVKCKFDFWPPFLDRNFGIFIRDLFTCLVPFSFTEWLFMFVSQKNQMKTSQRCVFNKNCCMLTNYSSVVFPKICENLVQERTQMPKVLRYAWRDYVV